MPNLTRTRKTKEKRDIILLSGMSRESRHWGDLPKALANLPFCHRVFTPDFPGSGRHWRKKSALTVGELRRRVRSEYLKENEEPKRKIIIGLSLGGMVAFDWVCKEPWEFTDYILINSSFGNLSWPYTRIRTSGFLRLLSALGDNSEDASERAILEVGSHKYHQSASVLEKYIEIQKTNPVSLETVMRQTVAAATFFPRPLYGLSPRGLVLASRRDSLVDYRCSQRIAHHYGLEIDVHPSAGHDLPLDDPQWVLEKIALHCG